MKAELDLLDNQLLSLAKLHIEGFEFSSNPTEKEFDNLVCKLQKQHSIPVFPSNNIYKILSNRIIEIINLEKGEKRSSLHEIILSHENYSMEEFLTDKFYYALFRRLLQKLSVTSIKNINFQPVNKI